MRDVQKLHGKNWRSTEESELHGDVPDGEDWMLGRSQFFPNYCKYLQRDPLRGPVKCLCSYSGKTD